MAEPDPTPGKSLWKVLVPIGVIILGACAAAYWVLHHASTGPAAGGGADRRGVGTEVADFTLERFNDGAKIRVSDLRASLVIVNFWASWCEACVVEMPSMVRLRDRFRGRGLEIAFVDVDENPEEVVPKVLEMLEIDFPTYVDRSGGLTDLFHVRGIPKTVILDRNRKILFTHDGEKDWDAPTVRAQVDQWLSL